MPMKVSGDFALVYIVARPMEPSIVIVEPSVQVCPAA